MRRVRDSGALRCASRELQRMESKGLGVDVLGEGTGRFEAIPGAKGVGPSGSARGTWAFAGVVQ